MSEPITPEDAEPVVVTEVTDEGPEAPAELADHGEAQSA